MSQSSNRPSLPSSYVPTIPSSIDRMGSSNFGSLMSRTYNSNADTGLLDIIHDRYDGRYPSNRYRIPRRHRNNWNMEFESHALDALRERLMELRQGRRVMRWNATGIPGHTLPADLPNHVKAKIEDHAGFKCDAIPTYDSKFIIGRQYFLTLHDNHIESAKGFIKCTHIEDVDDILVKQRVTFSFRNSLGDRHSLTIDVHDNFKTFLDGVKVKVYPLSCLGHRGRSTHQRILNEAEREQARMQREQAARHRALHVIRKHHKGFITRYGYPDLVSFVHRPGGAMAEASKARFDAMKGDNNNASMVHKAKKQRR